MSRTRPLAVLASAISVLVLSAVFGTACADREPEPEPPPLEVASLPDLGETQQQMMDLVLAVHAEIQRIAPHTAPWKWIHSYNTAPCGPPLTGQGEALYLPDLVTSSPLSPDEWSRALPAIETIAGDAGLTHRWSPDPTAEFSYLELSSDDGRTLTIVTNDSLLLTADISCRRSTGVIRGPDNRIPMPPNPQ